MNYLGPFILYVLTFIYVVYRYKISNTKTEGFANVDDQCIDEENRIRALTSEEKKELKKDSKKESNKKKETKEKDVKKGKEKDKKDKTEEKEQKNKKKSKEVFLIYNKVNYLQAKELCKLYSGRLATKEDLEEAFKEGANWCTWGWLEGEKIGYPVQEKFWSFIEKKHKGHCGPTAGLNIIENVEPTKLYSVTCYGKKPPKSKNDTDLELVLNEITADDSLQAEIERCKQSKKEAEQKKWIDEEKKKIRIVTFNDSQWSTMSPPKK